MRKAVLPAWWKPLLGLRCCPARDNGEVNGAACVEPRLHGGTHRKIYVIQFPGSTETVDMSRRAIWDTRVGGKQTAHQSVCETPRAQARSRIQFEHLTVNRENASHGGCTIVARGVLRAKDALVRLTHGRRQEEDSLLVVFGTAVHLR